MGKLKDFQKRLSKVKESRIEKDLLKIVKSEENLLVDANTEQLLRGEDSLGEIISPPYASKFYAEFKLHLNPAGVVDLKLTGAFHSKFKLITKGWPVRIRSTDKKAPELEEKYGEEIYGVQEETFGDINQSSIKPKVQEHFKRNVFELR